MLTTLYGRATKNNCFWLQDNNNGSLYENAVAQKQKTHEFKLYYYNSKNSGEPDFVIKYQRKVLPIEVKRGKNYKRHSALQ